MRLVKALVTNYRSIRNSEEFDMALATSPEQLKKPKTISMRTIFFLVALLPMLPSSFAQTSKNSQSSNHMTKGDEKLIFLDGLSKKMIDSVESIASKCAAAAAPACVSTIAAMPAAPPPEMDERSARGLLGDYVGGVYGTVIAAVTMIAVFLAWWTSQRIDYKSKTYQVFAEMLRTHEEIVSSIQLGGVQGRDAIGYILSEFGFVYKLTNRVAIDAGWSLSDRIEIAYTFTYYGQQLHTMKVLDKYDAAFLKLISDAMVKKVRGVNSRTKGRHFKGHQNRLSHYFRNLFSAYSFINSSKLSKEEKKALGKVLRAKLSNYEQALLALNMLSPLGKQWKDNSLVGEYMPIKNIPEHFFSFDNSFALKTLFPEVEFEWE